MAALVLPWVPCLRRYWYEYDDKRNLLICHRDCRIGNPRYDEDTSSDDPEQGATTPCLECREYWRRYHRYQAWLKSQPRLTPQQERDLWAN